ncbi:MAG: Fic family protein, partial [bacterium]
MYENRIEKSDILKKEIDSCRPIKGSLLKQIREYYRIGLTYSSNAIEGNSLTETETKIVLEDGITIGGKPLRDHYEAVGHSQAYDLLLKLSKERKITEENVLDLHRLFFYHIDRKNAGRYRKTRVIITGSRYIPPSPEKISELMKKFIEELPSIKKANHPIEYSALLHKEFVGIHPFIDGNGRIA